MWGFHERVRRHWDWRSGVAISKNTLSCFTKSYETGVGKCVFSLHIFTETCRELRQKWLYWNLPCIMHSCNRWLFHQEEMQTHKRILPWSIQKGPNTLSALFRCADGTIVLCQECISSSGSFFDGWKYPQGNHYLSQHFRNTLGHSLSILCCFVSYAEYFKGRGYRDYQCPQIYIWNVHGTWTGFVKVCKEERCQESSCSTWHTMSHRVIWNAWNLNHWSTIPSNIVIKYDLLHNLSLI